MYNKHILYKQLLRLYPKQYREQYSRQMLQTLDDMVEDQPTKTLRSLAKTKAYIELPFNIAQQNFTVAMMSFFSDTPDYAKQTSIIGAVLMVPFPLIVLTDATENSQLINSRAWVVALTIGLLALPALAFLINALSYLAWLLGPNPNQKLSLKNRVFDLKRTWPMLVVGGVGLALCLAMLFHDSAHCVIGNPIHAVRNPNQTWQCINKGFLGGSS